MSAGANGGEAPGALRAGALTLCRARRFSEAAQAFAMLAQHDGGGATLLDQARAHLLAGELQRAQDASRAALALDPSLLRGSLLLARIAERRGNPQGEIVALRRAVALRPQAASLRARLAALLARRGQHEAALSTARAALARDPHCHAASLVIMQCHAARGDLAQARLMAARLARARPDWAALEFFLDPPAAIAVPEPEPEIPAEPELPPALVQALAAVARPPAAPPSWRSPLDDLRILRALMLRNLQVRYGSNPLGLPLEVLRPIAVVLAHWALFALLHKPMPGEIPIPIFVLAGFSVWFAFNYSATGSANGARFPAGATLLPGVTAMHLRLARAAWPLLVNLVFCLAAVLPLRLFGIVRPLPSLPQTALIFGLAGALGVGFGLLAERLGAISPFARPIEKLITWALFVTSGLYFVVYRTLPALAAVLLWNPLLHLVEYERHAFDPGYPLVLVDLGYPAALAALLLLLGLAACRSIRIPA